MLITAQVSEVRFLLNIWQKSWIGSIHLGLVVWFLV